MTRRSRVVTWAIAVALLIGSAVLGSPASGSEATRGTAVSAHITSALVAGGRTKIKTLKVSGLQPGDVVTVTCPSETRGCTQAASSTVTAEKAKLWVAGVRSLVLAPRAKLSVQVVRGGVQVFLTVFTMVRGQGPIPNVSPAPPTGRP